MTRAPRSGIAVQANDVPVILGMVARDDRRHDIAAWFGLNQGRIKEVEDGMHGMPPIADAHRLPPSGSPGPKARDLRTSVAETIGLLQRGDAQAALRSLERAVERFDRNE